MRLSRRVPSSRGEESYAEKLYAIQASKASLQQRSSVGGRSRPSGNLTPALSGRHSGTSRGSSSRSAAMIDACVSLRHGFSTTPHTSSPSQSSTSVTSGVSRQWSTASSTELRRARAVDVCQTPAPGSHQRACTLATMLWWEDAEERHVLEFFKEGLHSQAMESRMVNCLWHVCQATSGRT